MELGNVHNDDDGYVTTVLNKDPKWVENQREFHQASCAIRKVTPWAIKPTKFTHNHKTENTHSRHKSNKSHPV